MKRKRVFSILQAAGIAVLLLFALPVGAKTEKPDSVASVSKTPGEEDIPAEAIDLGLPSGTLWASYNIGATKPEEYGDFFAWGETEKKNTYNWSNYSHCDGSSETCRGLDGNICGTQYDVAYVKWGSNWRMPTYDEINELVDNCTHTVIELNSVQVMKLTGPSGNSVYLPFSGYMDGTERKSIGYESGYYWSGENPYTDRLAPCMAPKINGYFSYNNLWDKYLGLTVRPVKTPSAASLKVEPTEIDFGMVESGTTKTKTFTVTNTGKSDLTFIVPKLDWRGYFIVSDTDTDFTLAPNTSKTISVTAKGMIRGESAGCYIQVKATTSDGELTETVQGRAEGWDHNPLTLASSSLKLSVGESSEVKITYGSLSYEITNDNPNVAEAHVSSNGTSSGGRYSSHHLSEGKVHIKAKSVGKATLIIKDKKTNEETTLTITVTDGNSGGNEGWRKTIIVTTLDGTTMEYLIDEDTKIKVEKPYLVIETDNVVLNYELENMKNLRYGKKFISDGIEDVIVENGQPFQYKDETLFFKDLPENSQVGIFTLDGKTVVNHQCSGEASLSLNSLPSGMYIVKINNESYKILKK